MREMPAWVMVKENADPQEVPEEDRRTPNDHATAVHQTPLKYITPYPP